MSKYSLTSHQMPPTPRLKGYLKHVISPVPKHIHAAAAQNVLIPTQQHLSPNTSFTYIDGTVKRGCDMIQMGITVAPSASGKGYLEAMYQAVSRYWKLKSQENLNMQNGVRLHFALRKNVTQNKGRSLAITP